MANDRQNEKVFLRAKHRLDVVCREIARGTFPSLGRLAEILEVIDRTIKRVIAFLRDEYRAPIRMDRARGGYFFTDANWRLPSMTLTEGELLAFFIAENSLRFTGQTPEAVRLRRALAKLATMLPAEIAVNLSALSENLSFENPPFVSVDPALLERLTIAATEQETVEFNYFSPHSGLRSRRLADVHLLHNFAGDWFAVSWDHEKRDFRDFHVGRMSDFRQTGLTFDRRADFKSSDYLNRGFSMMRGGRLTSVEIDFDAYQSQWIRERRHFHPDEIREELPDGGLRLSFKIGENGLDAVARFCLTYAGHCRVVKPKKLREIVVNRLEQALKIQDWGNAK